MSIISFVILDVLYSLSTQQRYKKSALRKKELIAFFESALMKYYMYRKSQESYFIISICQTGLFQMALCERSSYNGLFCRALEEKLWKH